MSIRFCVVFVWLGSVTGTGSQLPPEILVDQYLVEVDQNLAQEDPEGALEAIKKIRALQQEHDLPLPIEFHFKFAQVAFSTGAFDAATNAVNEYLLAAGREGEFYGEALELFLAIKAAAERTSCAGQPEGIECWMEIANRTGCQLWNPHYQHYKVVTWTGKCARGVAQGRGTLKWVWDLEAKLSAAPIQPERNEVSSAGFEEPNTPQLRARPRSLFRGDSMCAGQPEGTACWLELASHPGCYIWTQFLNSDVAMTWTAECAEGLAQGMGTLTKTHFRSARMLTEHVGYLEAGMMHGQWVERAADGRVWEGPFVEHKRHGQWIFRHPDGRVEKKFYVNGRYVGRRPEAVIEEGHLVEGMKKGDWVINYPDGRVDEGPFEEGKRQGKWVDRLPSGEVQEGPYDEGRRHGFWVWQGPTGIVWEGRYAVGKRHGRWVERYANGQVWEGPYTEGKKHGEWVIREKEGDVRRGSYVEGQRQGRWIEYDRSEDVVSTVSFTYDDGRIVPIKPEMVVIPGGRFRMGCVSRQNCSDREIPVHEVRVETFELSNTEVTFEEYDQFTAATGREWKKDEGWGRGRRPVIHVSWEDAIAYVKWLSEQTGEQFRLPSEAEWEYAARAGTETKYHFGDDDSKLCEYANHSDSSLQEEEAKKGTYNICSDGVGAKTAEVGKYRPNPYGLYDIYGNVGEWVQDCWNETYQGAPTDGSAWESGDCSMRVFRGALWFGAPWSMRSAFRIANSSELGGEGGGFRIARTATR